MTDEAPSPWLTVRQGAAPLLLCMPHTGTDIAADIEAQLVSPWLARKDTDWWIDRLYAFAQQLDASVVRTAISRSVIDANRDPTGVSLYPGQATTELCPTTTFDGEPLYQSGVAPSAEDIATRRRTWFEPYHRAVREQITRLRARHGTIVLYDCHAIRSQIPRLFTGLLPNFNIGTFSGASCAPQLTHAIEQLCDRGAFTRITNGRFKGGYTTRHYGRPAEGVHALQMELACRGYLREPLGEVNPDNWPCAYEEAVAAPLREALEQILPACIRFALAAADGAR